MISKELAKEMMKDIAFISLKDRKTRREVFLTSTKKYGNQLWIPMEPTSLHNPPPSWRLAINKCSPTKRLDAFRNYIDMIYHKYPTNTAGILTSYLKTPKYSNRVIEEYRNFSHKNLGNSDVKFEEIKEIQKTEKKKSYIKCKFYLKKAVECANCTTDGCISNYTLQNYFNANKVTWRNVESAVSDTIGDCLRSGLFVKAGKRKIDGRVRQIYHLNQIKKNEFLGFPNTEKPCEDAPTQMTFDL